VADGESLVRLRIEEEECPWTLIGGQSTCAGFTSGYKFDLSEHPRATNNGAYVLTNISHHASQPRYRSDRPEFTYQTSSTSMPLAVPFRAARRTPRPVVEGVQTAEV